MVYILYLFSNWSFLYLLKLEFMSSDISNNSIVSDNSNSSDNSSDDDDIKSQAECIRNRSNFM